MQKETSELHSQLKEKSLLAQELTVQLEDEANENKVLKKKHTLALRVYTYLIWCIIIGSMQSA